MGRRVQERHLNRAGSAPRLKDTLNSSTANGQILIWSQADQAFTIGSASGGSTVVFQCYSTRQVIFQRDGVFSLAQFSFDASNFSGSTFKLHGVLNSGDGSSTITVRLFNLTDSEQVVFSDASHVKINTTSSTPTILTSPSMTAGSSSGNLKTSQKIYELRAVVTGGETSSKFGIVGSVGIRIE